MKSKNRATNVTRPSALLLAAGQALVWFAPLATLTVSGVAMAVPQGPQVVAGSAGFSQNGSLMTITAANRTVINYSSFNVGRGETVRFVLPNGNSAVLNRVVGMMPSSINGSIQSNGIVYLINPAGIVFGNGATINASQFVAAAGNMSNADFLSGRNVFTGTGRLENYGRIEGATGVTLAGNQVANFGTIVSPQGSVVMAAGDRVLVGERQGRVFAQVTAPAQTGASEQVAAQSKVGVENSGTVSARQGRVVMGAGDMYATAIQTNRGSRIEARSVEIAAPVEAGRPASGRVVLSGEIDARGLAQGQRGGEVTVTGGQIALIGANIDASGNAGGGTVRIGGDVQGGGTMPRADATIVDRTSVVRADAIETGNGGSIVFWGDNVMRFFGTATARGGKLSGNGGMIETSGRTGLLLLPTLVDASSTFGVAGTWLVDPYDIEITNVDSNSAISGPGAGFDVLFSGTGSPSQIDAATLQAQLVGGTTVRVTTAGAGSDAGNITVNSPISFSAGSAATLELLADGSITFNAGITATNSALNLSLTSGAGVSVASGVTIDLNGGAFTSSGTGNVTMAATSSLRAGTILLGQTGDVTLRLGGTGSTAFGTGSVSGVLTVFSPVSLTSTGRITATRLDLRLTDSAAAVGSIGSRFLVSVSNRISLTSSGSTVGNDVFFDNDAGGSVLDVSGAGTNLRTVDGIYGNGSVTLGFGGAMNIGSTLRVALSDAAGNIGFTPGTSVVVNAEAVPGGGLSLLAGTGTGTVNTGTASVIIGGSAGDTPISLRAGGNSTVEFDGPVTLDTVNIGGNLTLSSINGSISRANDGQLVVGGDLSVAANTANDSIDLRVSSGSQANITGAVALTTSGTGDASLINQGTISMKATNVGGNLSLRSDAGSIDNAGGTVTVGGTTTLDAGATSQTVEFGITNDFTGTGAVAVAAGGDGRIRNQVATTLGNVTTGGTFSVTSVLGGITAAGTGSPTIATAGTFTATTLETDADITLSNVNATGAILLSTTGTGGDATITNARATVLGASTVGGNLVVTSTTGGITQTGAITIGGAGATSFTANGTSNNIVLGDGANTLTLSDPAATLAVTTTGTGNATVTTAGATTLAASTVGGNFSLTSGGSVSQSGVLTVTGTTTVTTTSAGDDINLGTSLNLLTGAVSLNTTGAGGDATLTTGRATVLAASNVGGNVSVTAAGALTDSGIVTAGGTGTFGTTGAANSLTLDQLAVTGALSVTTAGSGANATIVNATGITLASVGVTGTFAATAATGGISQSGAITSAGGTFVTSAADQTITLTNAGNSITGPISFTTTGSGGDVQLVNTTGTALAASSIGGDLTVSTSAGNITRSGTTTLTVGGALDLSTSGAGGSITHAALAVTGPIRVNTGVTGGDVAITNSTAVVLGGTDMVIGGTLAVTATTGSITDEVNVSIAGTTGTSTFTATASSGNITLDTTTSAGAIGFNTTSGGAGGNVTYTRASGNAIIGTSDVGRVLTITTSAGSITTGTGATIRVRGTGTGLAATDNSVVLTSRGSGSNGSMTLTGLRVDAGRLTASADQSVSLTSTTGLNISNIIAGELTGAGDLSTPPSVLVNATSIGLSGGITTNRGDITLAGGPLRLLSATVTLNSRYAGSAGAGTFNNTSFGSITIGGNVESGGTNNQRSLVIRTPNGNQYAGGTASTTLPIVRFNGTTIGSGSLRLASLTINSDSARLNEPAVATIFAPSGLNIFTGGAITFGEGERFTSGGSLTMNAASATFGDLSVLGNATFNVPSVTVRRRTGAAVAFTNPSEILFDLGTDIVISGTLIVSDPAGWTTSGTGERPIIATFSGSPLTSTEFTNVLLGGTYPSFADLFVAGSRPADFATGQTNLRLLSRSQGQTSIESAASELILSDLGGNTINGLPRFGNGDEATFVASSLSDLGVPLSAFRNGDRLVFERTTGRPMAGDTRSGVERFTEAGLNRALTTLKAVRELPSDASSQLQAAAEAFAKVRSGGLAADPVGFAAFLAGRGESPAADAALTAIAAHFQALGELGLTPSEALPARELAVDAVAGTWADAEQRTGLIRAAESRRLGRLAQR